MAVKKHEEANNLASTSTSKASLEEQMTHAEALQALCDANGFDCETDAEIKALEKETVVEMVLDELYVMTPLRHFQDLTSLTLCGAGIEKIEGLERCKRLKKLWLNENNLESLLGLSDCRDLEELYVCSNEITSVATAFFGLSQLKILWLAENRIKSIKGLHHCPDLQELNVARNNISCLGGALENNLKLKTLTIAGNKLAKFHEVEEITALPELRQLNFSDPDWGDNPICSLCNYWTYILYHHPHLQIFDKFNISPEALRQAESTYLKKHLYYNMRIKTVQRQAVDAFRWSHNIKNELLQEYENELEMTAMHLARIQASAVLFTFQQILNEISK